MEILSEEPLPILTAPYQAVFKALEFDKNELLAMHWLQVSELYQAS